MTPTPLVFHFYCIFINKYFSDFSDFDFFFKFQNFRICFEPRFGAKIREANSKLKMVHVNLDKPRHQIHFQRRNLSHGKLEIAPTQSDHQKL